ncbi:MAG: 6-bladed beta-propeller, partial [Bacteroidota bacterium]
MLTKFIVLLLFLMLCNCVFAQSDKLSIKLKINKIEKEIYFSKSSVAQLQERKIYHKRIKKIIEFGGIKDSLLFSPSGIKTDKRGNIFILDYVGRFVKKFSINGKLIKQYGRSGRGPGEFLNPFRIYLDIKDSLYVYDNQNLKLTAFLEKIYEFKTTNGLFVEFCPISKEKIIVLKGEPNSVELMETRNIKGKLLSKFDNLLEKKVIPPESFYL